MIAETIPLTGTLYIVATPIGNLDDITYRAVRVLGEVQLIAAEDTRHSSRLLQHYGITTPSIALHEHNEREQAQKLLERMERGVSIALISDAGTPLISDPGFLLVRLAREKGVPVVPVPGPSAVIAAISVSGLPAGRFCFEGFLPAREGPRRRTLEALSEEQRTLVFYESPRRIEATLREMGACFGLRREAVIARELTKSFETIRRGTLEELSTWVAADANQQRGELVILVHGSDRGHPRGGVDSEAGRVAELLAAELPAAQAARLAAEICGEKKNRLYRYLIERQRGTGGSGETKR